MKKKWFDDYNFRYTSKGGLIWKMPHTVTGAHRIEFRSIKGDARIKLLSDWLICALYDLDKISKVGEVEPKD